jgi:hypothetical protein
MYWEPMVEEPVRAKPRIEGGAGGAGAAAGAAGAWATSWAARTVLRGRMQGRRTKDSREAKGWVRG